MKNTLLFLTLFGILSFMVNAQEKLAADTSKTTLSWLGEKVTSQFTGTIKLQSGWLNLKDNKIVSGEFTIDMASIKEESGNTKLEVHLKSDDFFSVGKFPSCKTGFDRK